MNRKHEKHKAWLEKKKQEWRKSGTAMTFRQWFEHEKAVRRMLGAEYEQYEGK